MCGCGKVVYKQTTIKKIKENINVDCLINRVQIQELFNDLVTKKKSSNFDVYKYYYGYLKSMLNTGRYCSYDIEPIKSFLNAGD